MRRISQWEKRPDGYVLGKALQDLGYDCFAVYCTALVYAVLEGGWDLVLERPGFTPQTFHTQRRIDAMMLAEAQIAMQWSPAGLARLFAENPAAYRDERNRPCAIPLADCAAFAFWKKKAPIGPKPEPAYMRLLSPEAMVVAKLPWGHTAYDTDPEDEPDPEARAILVEAHAKLRDAEEAWRRGQE